MDEDQEMVDTFDNTTGRTLSSTSSSFHDLLLRCNARVETGGLFPTHFQIGRDHLKKGYCLLDPTEEVDLLHKSLNDMEQQDDTGFFWVR